ncbi:LIM domain and actin-binding protein 1 [Sarotherodon galilaeus]
MPEPTQNFLIRILVLWNTVITILLIVLFVLYFTDGHKGLENSAVKSSKISSTEERWTTTTPPSLVLSKAKMISFKLITDKKVYFMSSTDITWRSSEPKETVISQVGNGLSMNVDGYYFLNLQVTVRPGCPITDQSNVSLVHIQDDKEDQTLLEGSINKETNSTGILSKVVECGAGQKLIFNINKSILDCVDDEKHKTHLDIIFMPRP